MLVCASSLLLNPPFLRLPDPSPVDMDEYSEYDLRMIRLAPPETLEECGNDAYMEARGTIELLLAEVTALKTKNATLKYMPMYQGHLIDKNCREIIDATIMSRNFVPEAGAAAAEDKNTGLLPLGKCPDMLSRAEYPAVKYWRRSEYTRACKKDKGNTNALATARPKRGRPRAVECDSDEEPNNTVWDSMDPNKLPKHPYIETVDGRPASRETLSAIGIKARRMWQTFLEKGLAPTSWGTVTDQVCDYFN
jgi:hypothetical protein